MTTKPRKDDSMTDIRQPKDPEGGALLWSIDGTVAVRRTPSGFHVLMDVPLFIADPDQPKDAGRYSTLGGTLRFDVHRDDLEAFISQLKRLTGMGGY